MQLRPQRRASRRRMIDFGMLAVGVCRLSRCGCVACFSPSCGVGLGFRTRPRLVVTVARCRGIESPPSVAINDAPRGFSTPLKTWTRDGVEFQDGHLNVMGEQVQPKVLKYDSKDLLLGWGFLSVLMSDARVGTVFGDSLFIIKGLLLIFVGGVTRYGLAHGLPISEIVRYARDLGSLTTFLNGTLAFLLGLYISSILSRWWAVRTNCIGVHSRSINELCLLSGAWFSSASTADVATRACVRRYGLLSNALLYKESRGECHMLDDLVETGLLLPHEHAELQNQSSKTQAVWSWMTKLWHQLFQHGRTPRVADYGLCIRACLEGSAAAQRAASYTKTQLPLAYVQLLSFVVNFALLANALDAGFSGAADPGLVVTDIIAVVQLILFYVIFAGLLALGAELESPIDGGDAIDFPELAYQKDLCNETAMLARGRSSAEVSWWRDILETT